MFCQDVPILAEQVLTPAYKGLHSQALYRAVAEVQSHQLL